MIIDIHAHCYKYPVPFVTDFCDPEELIAFYDKQGIDKGVLLPVVNSEIYFPQSNDEILEICSAYPDRFIPYCNIDPRAMTNSPCAPLHKVLEYYKNKGCKGIGEVMPNMELMDPKVQNLFRAAEEVDLPIVFDGSDVKDGDFGLYDDPGLPQLEHTLQRFPKLKIFGHSQCFWSEIGENTDENRNTYVTGNVKEGRLPYLMRKYENLYCDMSAGSGSNAMMRDREYAAKFIGEFSDRMMYGCDICMAEQTFPFAFDEFLTSMRKSGEISEENYRKIVRENAIRELKL
jgi:predicted TIM-barrel fold metal-dependent hydrolase